MGQTLTEIAQKLKDSDKKVQLIYAFNGVGKTRLSVEFKHLISPDLEDSYDEGNNLNFLYYNAFTEDLFHWDNDLENNIERKIKIQPNSFTNWLLRDEGKENDVVNNFVAYTNTKLTPYFDKDFSEVSFSTKDENGDVIKNVKISKGEESCFVWSVFYSILELVISELSEDKDNRSSYIFDNLSHIFIDDPVTSLDENHLIRLAIDLAQQIKRAPTCLNFVITTHNPLFYNVLYNELKNSQKYILSKHTDGTYNLENQPNDSPFSYHLFLLSEIKEAIDSNSLQKYHFNMFRNILEKTSTFLGFNEWGDLLRDEFDKKQITRLINISSHSKVSSMEISDLTEEDRVVLKNLMQTMMNTYHFNIQQY